MTALGSDSMRWEKLDHSFGGPTLFKEITMVSRLGILMGLSWVVALVLSAAPSLGQDEKPVNGWGVFVHNKHKTDSVVLSLQVNDEKPAEYTLKPLTSVLVYEERSGRDPLPLYGFLLDASGKQLGKVGGPVGLGGHFELGGKPGIGARDNGSFEVAKDYFGKNAIDAKRYGRLERVEVTLKKGIGD